MLKKVYIKVESQEEKENLKNTRKTLRALQQTADNKENLAGRPILEKNTKLADLNDKNDDKCKTFEHKSVQTDDTKSTINSDDLTSTDEPSLEYWKLLAEKRDEQLNNSLQENERLKETIEALKEENDLCKQSLEESKALVEVLQELLGDEAETTTEVAEEATEDVS